jgi:ribosomal protein S18 acetylase RimI-like enzyme
MKEKVINILYESFYDYDSTLSICKQDKKLNKRFRLLLEYTYFLAENFGKIYLDKSESSCVLILDRKKEKTTIRILYWKLILILKVFGVKKTISFLKRQKKLDKARSNDDIHIWFVGTKITEQNKGVASSLLKVVLAEHKGKKITVETTRERNIYFYEKLGFKTYTEVNIPPTTFTFFKLGLK